MAEPLLCQCKITKYLPSLGEHMDIHNSELKTCFIICPIGKDGSPERQRSDALLKHVLAPVLESSGYKALRADHIAQAGMITTQLINLLIESPLVIADLTGGNPNVFYELALRHATGLPYIQLIEAGGTIPFDIIGVRTLQIDIQNLDSVEFCKKELVKYIESFHAGHRADSPISAAANIFLLQTDPKYAENLLEKLDQIHGRGWSNIDDIADKLDDIERTLDSINERLE